MKVMLNGTETNLRGAIKQTWVATKIYWRLRMNSHLMIEALKKKADESGEAVVDKSYVFELINRMF